MRKFLMIALNTVALLSIASLAFASDAAPEVLANIMWGSAIGMAIAAAGCGIAQGLGLKAACEGTARNPEASGKIQVMLILGLAFIESLAIYTLVVNLLLLFANPFV
ncbi:MAG: ATP synthase F0 subunit C [Proteobacteria bacterium]|nr:ATP synthase F0 subunit C [Pseudomonadota bacterium]